MELSTEELIHLNDNPLENISHVSLREAWVEIKTGFSLWFAFMVLAAIISLISWGWNAFFGGANSGLSMPKLSGGTWFSIIYCVVTWFGRGQTIQYRIPKQSFVVWFLFTFCVMAGIELINLIPNSGWLLALYIYTLVPLATVIDKLNTIGYQKHFNMKKSALEAR